ncbi:hypothetical protein [Phyllobacterium zundukense]|uniref:hypothetical protein n=1 Tax=Phyllobacterium zundukense TaxID=1867719 RepID=UPI003965BC23
MNFRYLLLAAVLGLSACNGSDSSTKNNEADSTFSDLENAKKELGKLNEQITAGLDALADIRGDHIDDEAIRTEIAPCCHDKGGHRADIVILACTHYPFPVNVSRRLAAWPIDWLDPVRPPSGVSARNRSDPSVAASQDDGEEYSSRQQSERSTTFA